MHKCRNCWNGDMRYSSTSVNAIQPKEHDTSKWQQITSGKEIQLLASGLNLAFEQSTFFNYSKYKLKEKKSVMKKKSQNCISFSEFWLYFLHLQVEISQFWKKVRENKLELLDKRLQLYNL